MGEICCLIHRTYKYAVWPDVGTESSPIFPTLPKKTPPQFFLNGNVSLSRQKVAKFLGNFLNKNGA